MRILMLSVVFLCGLHLLPFFLPFFRFDVQSRFFASSQSLVLSHILSRHIRFLFATSYSTIYVRSVHSSVSILVLLRWKTTKNVTAVSIMRVKRRLSNGLWMRILRLYLRRWGLLSRLLISRGMFSHRFLTLVDISTFLFSHSRRSARRKHASYTKTLYTSVLV